MFITICDLLVSAAHSGSPPVQRCECCSQSAWSAAPGGKAAAASSARWCSDRPEWYYGASPAETTPEEQGRQEMCIKHKKGERVHKFRWTPNTRPWSSLGKGLHSLGYLVIPLLKLALIVLLHLFHLLEVYV